MRISSRISVTVAIYTSNSLGIVFSPMLLILDCNSKTSSHIRSYLICLRHLIRSEAVTNQLIYGLS